MNWGTRHFQLSTPTGPTQSDTAALSQHPPQALPDHPKLTSLVLLLGA